MERVIEQTTRKNRHKTTGPGSRILFALAMSIFTKLAKPEQMAWMFDYRINWVATALQTVRASG